jgi:hypothetical protein
MPPVTSQDDSVNARRAYFPPVSPVITNVSKSTSNSNLFTQSIFTTSLQVNAPTNTKFELYDVSGKQVFSEVINSNNLDLSHLENGIYNIKLTEINQKYKTQKILKAE